MKKIFCKHFFKRENHQEIFIDGFFDEEEKTMKLIATEYIVTGNPPKSKAVEWLIGVFNKDSMKTYIDEKVKTSTNIFDEEALLIFEYALNYLIENS